MPMRPSVTSSPCRSPVGANYAIRVANRLEAQAVKRIRTQRPGNTNTVRCGSTELAAARKDIYSA
eukprot:3503500-Heterocapsa_arctica.AAC.1